ncbi:MAG: hypothetical protein HY905_25560 [Deltaproteobacteria bacterium]|nr:hypothetical protein [Deltaproteobacteria bacterium]
MAKASDHLVLDGDNEAAELEFELDAIAAMTVEDRYAEAIRLSCLLVEMMARHGHSEPPGMLQRPTG